MGKLMNIKSVSGDRVEQLLYTWDGPLMKRLYVNSHTTASGSPVYDYFGGAEWDYNGDFSVSSESFSFNSVSSPVSAWTVDYKYDLDGYLASVGQRMPGSPRPP